MTRQISATVHRGKFCHKRVTAPSDNFISRFFHEIETQGAGKLTRMEVPVNSLWLVVPFGYGASSALVSAAEPQ